LTASGRRRKLGAFFFNAAGSVAGTAAAAAVGAAKQQSSTEGEPHHESHELEPRSHTGVYFCEVKGVTHNNADGTNRAALQKLCDIGDTVQLVPEPNNPHDQHAIRVVLKTGQQIGYISARQAARFAGKVHLLTATVHSRVKDEWGNDTLKLRVVNSAEQQAHNAHLSNTKDQPPSLDPIQALQAEARAEEAKEGWQSTLIYFENAERGLYRVVLTEDAEHIRQALQDGMIRVGFLGGHDVDGGIKFTFSLHDGVPMDSPVAKRFVSNASEWIVAEGKNLCAKKGIAPPIVHDFEPSKRFADAQTEGATRNVVPSRSGVTTLGLGIAGLLVVMLIIDCLIYQMWWAAGILTAVAVVFLISRVSRSTSGPQ